ncbi:Metallophosphoesterase domain-containing protein 1 [Seminavis robusta]|uniref:Metallophosphoesterase domain-containing protein 1 n=1 Tax=Seminavis robusta TaxID=568900 RepID=A0A9N8H6J3_9STRA|nr:Metallophosphoesterase domain-containing protein 1 [Seminavis robusta]|eukprot:Sro45_g026990.1 Metallophosphoesterase domain-containing protein 1 (483) ;mRNA; r:89305-90753
MANSSAPASAPVSQWKLSVLCLASEDKASLISECSLVERVHHVRTVAAAVQALEKHSYHMLVVALGTTPEDQVIQRDNIQTGNLTSPLFLLAMRRSPLMYRIVFSRTACQSRDSFRLCIHVGADAVVCSKEELESSMRGLFNITDAVALPTLSTQDALLTVAPNKPTVSNEVVDNRRQREKQLLDVARGWKTHRFQQSHNWTVALHQKVARLVVTSQSSTRHPHETNSSIRVIHVSDTHNQHRLLKIPPGDMFLHSGDICNYKNPHTNLVEHFADFLDWLHNEICPRFAKVVFIAGNHDVYLDMDKLDPRYINRNRDAHQHAQRILQSFLEQHDNVSYLQNSTTTYRGLTIYGTPTCICRAECMGKRYLSNGFELSEKEREKLWSRIPENVDVLLTHVPPLGFGSDDESKACKLLTQQVHRHGRHHPLLHVFGHNHGHYGVAQALNEDLSSATLLLNGCQESLLMIDPSGGGSPLIVDLPLS